MFPDPPPDQSCEQFAIALDRVFIRAIGKGDKHTVEVLAYEEDRRFYRFDLRQHARVVRKFWKAHGVSDPLRLEGVVESSAGYGPLSLKGIVVGHDLNPTATDGDEKTYVLRDVELRAKS